MEQRNEAEGLVVAAFLTNLRQSADALVCVIRGWIVATFGLPQLGAACQGSDREPESSYRLLDFSRAVLLRCSAVKRWGVWRLWRR
jgi:hypothetical protein